MAISTWLSDNWIEVFGAVTGIIFVFLEIRQNLWLWPVGIITSAVYIWVFYTGKLYADMSLQGYYLVISVIGWYWWRRGEKEKGRRGKGENRRKGDEAKVKLRVTRINNSLALILLITFAILYTTMYLILSRLTDSPVPAADSFVTSLSIIATWMLARKIYEHWYLWVIVNSVSCILFLTRDLYATVILYAVYCIMSVVGLREWKKSL
jgi:nicotinamide mononucleotide transporter